VLHLKGISTTPRDWTRLQFHEAAQYCIKLADVLDVPYQISSKRNLTKSAINFATIRDLLTSLQIKLKIQKLPIFIDEAYLMRTQPRFQLDFEQDSSKVEKKPLFHFFVYNVQKITDTIQILCGTQWQIAYLAQAGTQFELL
jgi:hypothetical protein